MSRKYATKAEIFASLMAEAKKAESCAIALMDSNSPAAPHIWDMANQLFAKANAYSIRWSIKAI